MKLLRLWLSVTIAVVVVAFLAVPAFAVPVEGVFVSIPGGTVEYSTGPIYDAYPIPDYSGDGADWGKAEVKYWYWQDAEDWWYYTYQIINNDVITPAGGDQDSPPEYYHFGWFYNTDMSGDTIEESDQYVGIYMLSLVGFGAQSPTGDGPGDLVVTGFGGSSVGGNAWDDFPDPCNTGLDWENKTGQQVDPTRWFWDNKGTGKKSDDEWAIIPGETSTTNPYFQIASMWGPDVVTAEIVIDGYTADETHVQLLAYGDVMGPVIIPEPATCLLFALGGLALVSKHRRTR